jgi:hypothetical protein
MNTNGAKPIDVKQAIEVLMASARDDLGAKLVYNGGVQKCFFGLESDAAGVCLVVRLPGAKIL